MIDWLYSRRDPAAVATTLATLTLAWAAWRLAPEAKAPPPDVLETKVSMEELPPAPPPPPPPPPPSPQTPPPPTPTQTPLPRESTQPAPVQSPVAPTPAEPTRPTPPAPPTPAPPPPAHTPPAPPAPPPVARSTADDTYRGELRGYLNGIKRYPNSREARQLRPQGTVKVWIEIDRAGQLLGSGVDTSSGSLLLDNEALRTVRNGRFPPFPAEAFAGQSFHRFVVPIEYKVDGE